MASALPARGGLSNPARVLRAGMLVALLDILYVFVLWVAIRGRTTTIRLFQSIASGLLGRAAYEGGLATAALGGALHLLIACTWATLFLIAARRVPKLYRRLGTRAGSIKVGLVFGSLVWIAMDFVVLPLSQARMTPPNSGYFYFTLLLQHPVCVGLPIALIVGRGAGPAPDA